MQVTKPNSIKITRPNNTSNSSPSKVKSSTTSENKKSICFNESSNIKERVSIALSHTKDQCYQFISINSKDYNASKLFSSKLSSHDLNLLHKSIYYKINEEIKKITRACNTSSLSNNLVTASQKIEIISSNVKKIALLLKDIIENKLRSIKQRISSI